MAVQSEKSSAGFWDRHYKCYGKLTECFICYQLGLLTWSDFADYHQSCHNKHITLFPCSPLWKKQKRGKSLFSLPGLCANICTIPTALQHQLNHWMMLYEPKWPKCPVTTFRLSAAHQTPVVAAGQQPGSCPKAQGALAGHQMAFVLCVQMP